MNKFLSSVISNQLSVDHTQDVQITDNRSQITAVPETKA